MFFSNPVTNQEKTDVVECSCVSWDRLGDSEVTNSSPSQGGSRDLPSHDQLCSSESHRNQADGQSALICVVWIRKTGKVQSLTITIM